MMAWMYATRIPAFISLKIKYDPEKDLPAKMHAQIPGRVRWKAGMYSCCMLFCWAFHRCSKSHRGVEPKYTKTYVHVHQNLMSLLFVCLVIDRVVICFSVVLTLFR